MSNTLTKIDLTELPKFVIVKDGEFIETTWDYFNPENTNKGKILSIGEMFDAELVLDLDGDEGTFPVEWQNILDAVDAINTRIDNGLDFAHFTNYKNPTFFYRVAMGINHFGEEYTDAVKNSPESMVLVSMAFILVKLKEQKIMEKQGYLLRSVFSTDGNGPNLVCSVGLDRELIIVGKTSTEVLHSIINTIAKTIDDDRWVLNTPIEMPEFVLQESENTPLRIKLKMVTDEKLLERYGSNANILIQIFFADAKNILPDEEGYDESLLQTLTV